MVRRSFLIVLGVLAATAPPAGAQSFGSEQLPLKSDNVTPLLTLPIGKPIGARFRDEFMYVTGTEGLSIYDVSDPALPVPTGFLPLPHFENEDVDIGGDVLLISNDPSEGAGILYVIDISDPAAPMVKGIMPNGIHDGTAGDIASIFGVSLPGEVGTGGIGHTASCVNADCTFAYLAGTGKGIQIVDLRDPTKPVPAGRFVPDITGLASHDVQIDEEGIAWIVGNSGTAGYDVSDPLHPVQVARSDEAITWSGEALPAIRKDLFDFSEPSGGVIGYGEGAIDLIHHNSLRLGTLYEPPAGQTPAPTAAAEPPVGSTTVAIESSSTRGPDAGPPTVAPAGQRKARAKTLRRCKKFGKAKRRKACARRVKRRFGTSARGRAATRAAPDGSLVLAPFAQQAGKTYPAGGNSPLLGVVEEDYNRPTCEGAGSFQLWGMTADKTSKGSAKLGLLDSYTTELDKLINGQSGWAPVTGLCSAHYFDYRDGIVAGGWYEEGTRFLDVRDPTNIKQVGYWVPTKGETWSVVFPPTDPTGSIVYALDFARGIDVLKLDRSDLKERVQAPVRRSWLQGSKQSSRTGLTIRSRFGYVCRLPA